MEQLGTRLRLAHYNASDGPRVVIFGPSEADFSSLQDLFILLSHNPAMSCSLESQSFIAAFGGIRLELACSEPMFQEKQNKFFGLRRTDHGAGIAFVWRRTGEGWDYLAKLIDPIVSKAIAAHQYLTSYPSEDAIVVVSKAEYGDEVLRSVR